MSQITKPRWQQNHQDFKIHTFKLLASVKLRRRIRTNRTNLGAFSLKSTGDYRKGQFKRTNTPANKQESKQTRKEARLRFPDTPALHLMNMCT